MNEKCQVFTPEDYVEKLLDSIGYNQNLYGKSILENSCGDGNILKLIVKRYIYDCRNQNISKLEIMKGLQNDIWGIEVDIKQLEKCRENLNCILNEEGLDSVNWNLVHADFIRWKSKVKFDFIVGNPPYITYKELNTKERNFLKKKFVSCSKGKFDYCYAFIEKSIKLLGTKGKMSYLVPGSIFKSVYGENLRRILIKHVESIYDFTKSKIFSNILVKSSIIVISKINTSTLRYLDENNGISICIPKENLSAKWYFVEELQKGNKRFGDYYKVSNVVATLLNEAFVIKEFEEFETYISIDNIKLEKTLIKNTATPRSLRYQRKEKIIFPYRIENEKISSFLNEEFDELFPNTKLYLKKFESKLLKRKVDQNARWFEYGRSQALQRIICKKLLISTVITDIVNVYELEEDCIPYAGLYIYSKSSEWSLESAKNILESDSFMVYALSVGIHISGTSVRITSKDIENYRF